MIKNIVFDLGNVILKGFPADVLNIIDLNDDERKIVKEKFFSNWNKLDMGNESLQEHYLRSKIPISLRQESTQKIIDYYKYREFNTDLIKLIQELKREKYNVYILSNNNSEASEYLRKLQLFESIDGWVVSCDYHIIKPDKKIYEILFEKYNLNPNECYFIDDKKINIEVGKSLGMNGYVINYEKTE